ncbi:DUF3105 domain-containing protein [Actinopolymorpha alba]|uniref:DUF3105 domain-containing protein n=1 Tax=Actinopolymorpha alba TaxID=533267 RepID=UPI000372BC70|nr:DUF3105 domain-containing protein [Actinopolymorpha alba]
MAKRKPTNRRERIEQLRREQQRTERRRTALIIVACTLVGLVIIGAAAWVPVKNWINDPGRQPMSAFGVPAAQAGLDPVVNDSAAGVSDHVDTGQKVNYTTAPPSAGPHWEQPASFGRKFYTDKDRPAVETLVHNLEHGYTIVWYDETIAKDSAQLNALKDIARRFESSTFDNSKKLIVAPWFAKDGKFKAGKHIALTHWSTDAGHRQYATKVSGEAIEQFMKKYPASQSPEPNAA